MIITVGFFLPSCVFTLNARSITDWINAIGGLLLGWIALYVIKHQDKPNVKRFLERF
ncbi:hypothetical protein [Sulfuricurvum sp.]|uniref:hypothetical protein n=1 Tax=Sulfuricurvum sp. TaxID=2025608 RepID=UPI00262B7A8C|nr:hypothetical protein [Sulfuricurvum sp.]MDD3595267.1 hypothetical protein [Sulfuricurvum sp.]